MTPALRNLQKHKEDIFYFLNNGFVWFRIKTQ